MNRKPSIYLTQDLQRIKIREELIKEFNEPEKTKKVSKSNTGLCKRAKFIERNKRDMKKERDLK
jgi:hypothetical protein